ncbi:MAG: hypothetical protein ACREVI_11945 [Steroidobacteraceae bacterium]
MTDRRQLISIVAMLIATIYYFFGKAEAATPIPAPAEIRQTFSAL